MEALLVLPHRVAGAAENMARDWLLLDAFAGPDLPRLRTYGWSKPAWTFGYSQHWAAVSGVIGEKAELIRRPTGGGLVDHRADWTYALVLPATHPLAQAKAVASYHAVHQALTEALKILKVPAVLKTGRASLPQNTTPAIAVCFTQPELHDVVRADDGRKIAGAAQKRTKQGLLLQGSVSHAALAEISDWGSVADRFALKLAELLQAPLQPWSKETAAPALLAEAQTRFASLGWNQRR